MDERGKKQVVTGLVVSDKMQQTIRVEVKRRVLHPVYKKYITKKKKFSADTGGFKCSNGDTVKIISSKPISKSKRWRVFESIEKNKDI